MMPRKALTTDRFGRLTIIGPARGGWLCRCDCGAEKIVTGTHLREGRVLSCGCLNTERRRARATTHGQRGTGAYNSWLSMRQRCGNPRNPDWPRYGGRGIRICARWTRFENFLDDMGQPAPGESIDRIDNDGPYEPGNCRWAARREQNLNTRRNRHITLDGVTKTLVEWCDELGLRYWTVHARLRRGESPAEALR